MKTPKISVGILTSTELQTQVQEVEETSPGH